MLLWCKSDPFQCISVHWFPECQCSVLTFCSDNIKLALVHGSDVPHINSIRVYSVLNFCLWAYQHRMSSFNSATSKTSVLLVLASALPKYFTGCLLTWVGGGQEERCHLPESHWCPGWYCDWIFLSEYWSDLLLLSPINYV